MTVKFILECHRVWGIPNRKYIPASVAIVAKGWVIAVCVVCFYLLAGEYRYRHSYRYLDIIAILFHFRRYGYFIK